MKYMLKWKNKYSGEEGYVGTVSKVKRCFTAVDTRAKAKIYPSENAITKDVEFLTSIGETANNYFYSENV